MFKTTIRGLLAHRVRLVTTALAVALGVAFMAGTLVLTDTVRDTFDRLYSDVYRGTDAVVREKAAFEAPQNMGTQRGRVDASLVNRVKQVPGVAAVEGQVLGFTRIMGRDGKALGNPSTGAPTYGANWSDFKQLQPFRLVDGRAPAAADEVVIDRKSARDGHLNVGDTTTVLVQRGPQHVRISGIAKFGNADSPGGASFVLYTQAVAQRLVAEPGKFDSISIVAKPGVSQTELAQRLQRVVPQGAEAVTGAAIIKESQSDIRKSLSFFNTFLLIFVIIALFVGAFMIFNTFAITVAQRTRENALLRAIGASRGQVLRSVLIEASTVGLLASLIGLAVGVGVAAGLKALLAAVGFEIPAGGITFSPRTVVISLVVGVGITLIAAASPARKAGKVPPVAALREVNIGSTGYGSKQRLVIGLAVLALGVASLLYGLFSSVNGKAQVVGLGALLVFLGVSVLGRTVALPLSQVIGAPLPRLRGIAGRLGRQNAMRNPKRTAASASALMIGVGLVAFITILAASTKTSIKATIDRSFTGDYVIDSGSGTGGGVDPGLAKRLRTLPGVEAASGVRQGIARVNGTVTLLTALDPTAAFDIVNVKPLSGSPAALGRDAIAIHKDVAKDKHLRVGDTIPVEFKDTGIKRLRVALIYGEKQPIGSYLIGTPAHDANFADHVDAQVYVKRSPNANPATTLAALKRVTSDYPGAKVLNQADLKNQQTKQVNQLLTLVYALLGLAIIIALLGIGNTLALSIFERTREIGVLRAVGMSRSQLRSTIRWESMIIALQGTILGLLIGMFFGWALVKALNDQGVDHLTIPVFSLIIVLVLAAIAGVVAAILPARRAAKLNVLSAITSE